MNAVGADQYVGGDRIAVLELRLNPIAPIDELCESLAEVDALGRQQACQGTMQPGGVKRVVGRPKFLRDHCAERRPHEEAPVAPTPLVKGAGFDAASAEPLGKAEAVQQPRRIRADVDAGAERTEG